MKKILMTMCVMFMVLSFVSGASALSISLSTATVAYGEDTGMPAIEAIIFPLMTGATELYRVTPPDAEEKALAGSYETTFSPATGDRESALIEYVGGPVIGNPAYLLAKDGSANDTNPNTHAWYLYDLTALGWNGTDDINITGLWPAQGSFSHISMYGSRTVVPEPTTLLLLGLGLVGLAGIRKGLKK